MLFQWFSIKCAGVALLWFGSEYLLWAGLEALFGCTPVVHATSHCFCGWCPHQIWDCLQGEQHIGFFSALVTFLRFSLLQYMFRVQMRKANMLVHLCLPIWKQSRWTWKKRKSVNDRCMTSAFICSNSTVTGECPWFAKISLILNVQVNQSQPLMHTITWIMRPNWHYKVIFFFFCRHYSLQQLLDPLTVTWERLDYRLSWHLWGVLQALHYSHLSASRQGLLHSSYAAQLESAGLWHLAVFILMHIPDHTYIQLIFLIWYLHFWLLISVACHCFNLSL